MVDTPPGQVIKSSGACVHSRTVLAAASVGAAIAAFAVPTAAHADVRGAVSSGTAAKPTTPLATGASLLVLRRRRSRRER